MIKVIVVGKIKESALETLIQDYQKRIKPFVKLELIELKDEPNFEQEDRNQRSITLESDRILKAIQAQDQVILCDLQGSLMDSNQLSETLHHHQVHGQTSCLIIGGSLGVDERVRARAQHHWKLSANTFPHGLVRLLVLEQIYRAYKIMHNQPYHK